MLFDYLSNFLFTKMSYYAVYCPSDEPRNSIFLSLNYYCNRMVVPTWQARLLSPIFRLYEYDTIDVDMVLKTFKAIQDDEKYNWVSKWIDFVIIDERNHFRRSLKIS